MVQFRPLDPARHTRHELHDLDRDWPETNCYVDLWIEVLHAAGLDPHAMLPFVFAIDVEGDQWTFVKPPLAAVLPRALERGAHRPATPDGAWPRWESTCSKRAFS